MANEIEKLNTIEISDIEKVNTITDDNNEKLNTMEFTGVSSNAWQGVSGFIMGGWQQPDDEYGDNNYAIGKVTIASTGDATQLDDEDPQGTQDACVSSGTRILITTAYQHNAYGGYGSTGITKYYTAATGANSATFGYWDGTGTRTRVVNGGAVSSGVRGVHAGGMLKAGTQGQTAFTGDIDRMDYWTIASTGDNTDFGDLSAGARKLPGGFNDSTRGVFAGGRSGSAASPTYFDNMEYITIGSTGNTTDFGDLYDGREGCGADNDTRGCLSAGQTARSQYWNTSYATQRWDYVTTQSTGNSSDLGDQTASEPGAATMCDASRAVFKFSKGGLVGYHNNRDTGSNNSYSAYHRQATNNVISYMTISSTGDETDFGDWGRTTTMSAQASGA